MNPITFSLNLDPYLAQWFSNRHGHKDIISLRKGSVESILVQRFSRRKSEATQPDIPVPGALVIAIPENKAKPAEEYSYISPKVKEMLVMVIRDAFDLCMFEDLVKPKFPDSLKRELIEQWMEHNGIELTETNWLAVDKRYYRLRRRLMTRERVRNIRKKHRN